MTLRLTLRVILAAALAAVPGSSAAQGGSDIFLVQLSTTGTGSGAVPAGAVRVVRVTNRPGYNNQPSFLRDSRTLLYTAIDSAGQADIWKYDIETRRSARVTKTAPESEYSPTQLPGQSRFSVIRVERDSTQRLWSFRLNGTDARLVLDSVKPVGYQAWIDANHVAVFVLGNPATLRIADVRDGRTTEIARGIGRALQPMPGRAAVSFTRRDSANVRWIEAFDVMTNSAQRIIRPFAENEYHVWLPTGALITAKGSSLYRFKPGTDADWTLIADLASWGVQGASRLAVSADGRYIAVVSAQ